MQIGGFPFSLILPATSVAYGCLPMLRRALLGKTGGVAVEKTAVGTQCYEGFRCTYAAAVDRRYRQEHRRRLFLAPAAVEKAVTLPAVMLQNSGAW